MQQPLTDVTANNSVSNITAQLGGTAYLHCLVGHLNERGVSCFFFKLDSRHFDSDYTAKLFALRDCFTKSWIVYDVSPAGSMIVDKLQPYAIVIKELL